MKSVRAGLRGALAAWLLGSGLLAGCATVPHVQNVENACTIFQDQSGWYEKSLAAQKKWGVPIHIQLAIIHQESRFKHDAKPSRSRLFWFIPGPRPSTAFGYAQALDGTWEQYRKHTGVWGADRDDFGDAVDFIGWYVDQSHKKCGISKWDARLQYLAYHEGQRGYNNKTYNKKPWLLKVAQRVENNAARYRMQLTQCRKHDAGGLSFWPF
ncbi:MAG: transglycosylase SLT domain-containing protein [Magnetococcales bacterium]|nr:transglycosylase SLT domain-containing protein [Magnetococcales bacterium]